MTINYLTPNDSYLMYFNLISIIIFKPFTIGLTCYMVHILKFNKKITIIEFLLTVALIYQIGFLIEVIVNSFIDHISTLDLMSNMNSNNNVPNDNIPRNRDIVITIHIRPNV